MKSLLLIAALCMTTVTAQVLPSMTGMGGTGMQQNIWQQFLFYRLIFGDAAAKIIMADRLATIMGNSPFSRYYAGNVMDTPDAWWIMSSLLKRNEAVSPIAY